MSADPPRILPADLAFAVEEFVGDEFVNSEKYAKREPLDDSGVFSLHRLAALIYAAGWEAGERAEVDRQSARLERRRRAAAAPSTTQAGDQQ